MVQPTQSNVQRRLSPLFRSIPWNAIDSECIRLSGAALVILITLAKGLGTDFDPLLSFFFPGPCCFVDELTRLQLTRLLFREQKAIFPQKSRPHSSLVQSILQRQVADNLTCGSRRALYCLKCFQSAWTRAGSLCTEIFICYVEMRSMQRSGRSFFGIMKCCFRIEVRLSTLSSLNYSQLSSFAAPLTPMAHKRLLGAIPHPVAG